ncbi:retron St85 family RNA-directed DNA polymerase [Limnobacter sp. P1]|uniref:retron St85 family RNA-directed DNA polymerase n=1 Tax=Limnobacter olei TaxID=3031298 RepID=UPI0023AFFEAC|nr:retron St85 family RNA-directed DNA polymerase [Limnobacter sp. P1]
MNKEFPIIEEISKKTGLLSNQVASVMITAPLRYKVFTIPKKTKGVRKIAQPSVAVKMVQRHLIEILKLHLPVSSSCMAYVEGKSIRDNAEAHKSNNIILKLDFENFFNSIKFSDIEKHLRRHLPENISETEIKFLCHALTWSEQRSRDLCVCIGAPSSPFISNSIMYDFDMHLQEFCSKNDLTYSRYADDLTFSSPSTISKDQILGLVELSLQKIDYPNIKINHNKTVLASKASRRTITGINITPEGNLSTGRSLKRKIHSLCCSFIHGKLDTDQIEQLQGYIAFVESIEPGFKRRLLTKYKQIPCRPPMD